MLMRTILTPIEHRDASRIDMQDAFWKDQLRALVEKQLPIAFDSADMERILELERELTRARYEHQILQGNVRRHFLVPLALRLPSD